MKTQFSSHVALRGSEKNAPSAKKVGGINKDEVISVTLKIKPKNELPNMLNSSVNEKFTPLTRESFQEQFGASIENVQQVEEFAHHFGLSIVETNLGQRAIELRGTVLQMEEAFKVELANYRQESGQTFRGRTGEIRIPQELTGVVEGVFGLDNREAAKIKIRVYEDDHNNAKGKSSNNAFFPNQLARIYNYPTDATGKKQCLALIELGGGYRIHDINAYFQKLNIKSPKVIPVSVDG